MQFSGANIITSVISMSAITYDRLTAIVLSQETRLSKRGAKIVISITWIIGISLSSPLLFYRTYKVSIRFKYSFIFLFVYIPLIIFNIRNSLHDMFNF